ncbi:hypothetical protein AB0O20_27655 [Streptomyces kronopolitis]|uniref:hypothetical protein n=1 Tax=Streptomyces kronopolitis TaxID=1612435 RepID=UPI00342ED9C9
MDRTQHHPPTTPAPLAALLTTAAAVIDTNPHMQPTAVIGPRFVEGLLILTTRSLAAPAREQARTAGRAARAAAIALHGHRRDGARPETIRAAIDRADAATRTAAVAVRQLAAVEEAAGRTVAAALAALGPIPAGTTRAQLSAAMRAAAARPALAGAAR